MYLAYRRSIGFRGRDVDPLKYPCLHRTTQTKENFHTSVPCVAFEPTFPVFERWKASHAIDPVATVIGTLMRYASHLSAFPSQDPFFFFSPCFSGWDKRCLMQMCITGKNKNSNYTSSPVGMFVIESQYLQGPVLLIFGMRLICFWNARDSRTDPDYWLYLVLPFC